MVTLVVKVSPVVYNGDDTAIDFRMRQHSDGRTNSHSAKIFKGGETVQKG